MVRKIGGSNNINIVDLEENGLGGSALQAAAVTTPVTVTASATTPHSGRSSSRPAAAATAVATAVATAAATVARLFSASSSSSSARAFAIIIFTLPPWVRQALTAAALSGTIVNAIFLGQEGPLSASSTAVPLWLSLLLLLELFGVGGGGPRYGAAVMSAYLTGCFAFVAKAPDTWPWALLLTITYMSSSSSSSSPPPTDAAAGKMSATLEPRKAEATMWITPPPHPPRAAAAAGAAAAEAATTTRQRGTPQQRVLSAAGVASRSGSSLVLALLCVGATVLCWGILAFPASDYGTFSTITLGTGETLDIFWHCEGGEAGDNNDKNGGAASQSTARKAPATPASADASAAAVAAVGAGAGVGVGGGGAAAAQSPTLMLDADASHGAADLWPLQRELTARGLRSCVLDKPGQGWSSPYRPSQQGLDPLTATSLMYAATGESPPYRLVGWGGGGENVWRYALKRPGDVDSLVFLDTYGDGVEWRAYAAARMPFGPTPNASTATTATNTATKEGHQAADGSQLDGTSTGTGTGDDDDEEEEDVAAMMAYRAADLSARRRTFQLVRLLAVPFGLGPLLFQPPADAYDYPERFTLYKWFYWTAPTWTSQWFTLRSTAAAQGGWLQQGFLDYRGAFDGQAGPALAGTPVLHIMSNPANTTTTTTTTTTMPSKEGGADDDDDVAAKEAAVYWQDRLFVANVTGNPSFAFCTEADCDQGFPLRYPAFTAEAIRSRFVGA